MMVLFTSRSEKKAIPIVRRILDCFADRIGNDTWQTVITHEGLQAVNRLLRRTATKSTAVSCRWIRSRSRSQLLWIVGNRQRFDSEGRVPVNWTAKNILHNERENEWSRMPELKALTALASLLHDWGKCSDYFQAKLREHRLSADPFRHEWISCKLLEAVVHLSQAENDDAKWLTNLASGNIRDTDLQQTMMETEQRRLEPLPPVAEYLAWIIFCPTIVCRCWIRERETNIGRKLPYRLKRCSVACRPIGAMKRRRAKRKEKLVLHSLMVYCVMMGSAGKRKLRNGRDDWQV